MGGSWTNTATTSLTLPTGATSGARIVLDGGNDVILMYDTTGSLILSMAATAGTDGQGNAYPAGLNVAGGQLLRLAAAATGDTVATAAVFGDAAARWDLNADGTQSWGGGTGAPDTNLYRSQTDQLNTDGSFSVGGIGKIGQAWVKTVGGVQATWQTPTFKANWSAGTSANGLAGPGLRYRLMPDDTVWIYGLAHAATGAGTVLFTLPTGYYPTSGGSSNVGIASNTTGGTDQAVNYAVSSSTGNFSVSNALGGYDYVVDVRIPLGNIP